MKYKNFLIRLFDLILVLGLLAGYQAVIYSRDKEATIAELKSQVNQLQGEKEDILEAAKNSGKLGEDEAYLSMAKDIVKTILDKQTTEVDTISGATYSSTGIKNAVGQALEGAAK